MEDKEKLDTASQLIAQHYPGFLLKHRGDTEVYFVITTHTDGASVGVGCLLLLFGLLPGLLYFLLASPKKEESFIKASITLEGQVLFSTNNKQQITTFLSEQFNEHVSKLPKDN